MASNRNSMIVIVLSAAVMGLPYRARAAEVTVGADAISAYVFRGETINADPVVQPSVEVTQGGLSLEVWGNMDLGSDDGEYDRNQFSEIDVFLTYTFELEAVSLLVGYQEFTYPGLTEIDEETGEESSEKANREVFVGASTEVLPGLTLGLSAFYEFEIDRDFYVSLDASYHIVVTDKIGVSLYGSIGYAGKDMSVGGEAGFNDYLLGANVTFGVTEQLELSAFVNYVDAVESKVLPSEFVRENVVGGIGAYYSF